MGLAKGSAIIVNVTNGEYVVGETDKVALQKYREKYARQLGWISRIEDLP